MNRSKLYAATGTALLLTSATFAASLSTGTATAAGDQTPQRAQVVETHAMLNSLNNSGVWGQAEVDVRRRHLDIDVDAHGLLKNMPHAQHIHYGEQARNECPTADDDANRDFRLTTAEGVPAYGPVKVSLTTKGATGAGSVLAVDRYPTAPRGNIHYDRQTRTQRAVARAIKRGEGVVVIHGVDYNNNGQYDFDGAGKSELDPNLPAEATDPAACGVLTVKDARAHKH